MQLTDDLRSEYNQRFSTLIVKKTYVVGLAYALSKIMGGEDRYKIVANDLGMPWYVIGLIHGLECDYDFSCHLHNGDPLDRRTVNVPKNRPVTGKPPFLWETSAKDALTYDGFADWKDWSVAGVLYKLEGYNGWGYRRKNVASPYLWGGTQFYANGKFVKDGKFSRVAVSQQLGAAPILKRMTDLGLVNFDSFRPSICEEPQQ